MKLTRLENIYNGLRKDNETYFIFPFKKGRVTFDILFDIFDTPYKLHFLQQQGDFNLVLLVSEHFYINTFLGNNYQKLVNILGLRKDPNNPFSTNAFFSDFNNAIPLYRRRSKEENKLIRFYNNQIEDKEKPYFLSFTRHSKESGRHVTKENLFKTRLLYPNEYDFCKRNNVSINYTDMYKGLPDRKNIED
jgi:hypothetical protein